MYMLIGFRTASHGRQVCNIISMILLASPDSNSIIPAIHGKGNVQLKGKAPAALFFSDVTPGLG